MGRNGDKQTEGLMDGEMGRNGDKETMGMRGLRGLMRLRGLRGLLLTRSLNTNRNYFVYFVALWNKY